MTHRLYRTKELIELLGISRSTLNNWTSSGHFPAPIKLGSRAVAWSESDVQGWIASQRTQTGNREQSE